MNSSDSAEELIKIYLDGIGFTLRIAGEGSKNLIAFLIAMSKDNKQTTGKTRLTNMLKTGKELKIFTIKAEDLKKFSDEAKNYGILYCVLADKKNNKIDGLVDIMVKQEDAAKVNRIAERFDFAKVTNARVEEELKEKSEVKETQEKSKNEQMADELLEEQKELEEIVNSSKDSPSNTKSEEKNQLENSSNTKNKLEENDKLYHNGKKSVKKELEQIEKELDKKQGKELEIEDTKDKENIVIKEKQNSRHLKEKQEKNKPKHMKEPKHLDTQNNKKRKKNKIKGRSK